jgi:copper chaperone
MSTSVVTLTVPGMTCGHCTAAVTKEVMTIGGVTDVAIDLATKVVTVTVTDANQQGLLADLTAAIDEAGFSVES